MTNVLTTSETVRVHTIRIALNEQCTMVELGLTLYEFSEKRLLHQTRIELWQQAHLNVERLAQSRPQARGWVAIRERTECVGTRVGWMCRWHTQCHVGHTDAFTWLGQITSDLPW